MKPRAGIITLLVLGVAGIAMLLAILSSPKPPEPATAPSPQDRATGVALEPRLSWAAGAGAISHELCLGTLNPPPVVMDSLTATEYHPERLEADTTYFWQVNEVGKSGALTRGAVWSFTTAAKPKPVVAPTPVVSTPPKELPPPVTPAPKTVTASAATETAPAIPDPEAWREQPEVEFGPGDALLSGGVVKLYLGDYTVKRGETFDVCVSLTAPPLESMILSLAYDPTQLEMVPDGGRPVNPVFRKRPEFTFSQEKGVVVVVNSGAPGAKNLNAVEGKNILKFKMRATGLGETSIRPGTGCCFTNGLGKDERYEVSGGRVLIR
jgi:hypothetical protein